MWFVAVRPWAYTASVTPVLLGLSLARYDGYPVRWGLFGLTLVGVLCFHTAANLLNDHFDYLRGVDREAGPGSGAVVRGWITPRQARRAALLFLLLGIGCGAALTCSAGPVVLLLGVAGTAISLGYTGPRLCLKYAGLGDLAILLAFGVLPVFGTYWVQARRFDWLPIAWSLPPAMLTVGILHANNWRDLRNDAATDCRTLAGVLGERGSAAYHSILTFGPWLLACLYFLAGTVPGLLPYSPPALFAVFVVLPAAVRLRMTRRESDGAVSAVLDSRTARLQFLFAATLAAAFFFSRH